MKRILVIAYTGYSTDARVKRHTEASAGRGDVVDVICLREQHQPRDGSVNVIRFSARLKAVGPYFGSDSLEYAKPGDPVGVARAIERPQLDLKRRASMIERAGQVALRLGRSKQRAGLFEAVDSILVSGSSDERPFAEAIGCERWSRISVGS